ncbi:MAG: E3 binding domain-containing protein, partial [Kutzneria sp.]|nr:E3 binding domain-containing protein [Kutzneria sp.]
MTSDLQLFRLPDLGEGLTEAEVLGWRVAVGDTVQVDQIVVEVETAKAAVEVPVPYTGTVAELHAEVGAVIAVGQPLISVAAASSAAERYRNEERAGSGNVLVGYGTKEGRRVSRRRAVGSTPRPAGESGAGAVRVISPLVRKLAKDNGVDIAAVAPTGPGSVVLRRDVESVISRAAGSSPAMAAAADAERIPLKGVRGAIAERVSRSRAEIPDATTWVDV